MSAQDKYLPHLADLRLRDESVRDFAQYKPANGRWHQTKDLIRSNILFVICVVLPVCVVATYYIFIAADMYVSEARFIVRSSSISPRLGGAASVGQVSTLVRTNDDTQSVNAYIASRDALDRLISEDNLLDVVSRPEADLLARFPRFWFGPVKEPSFNAFRTSSSRRSTAERA